MGADQAKAIEDQVKGQCDLRQFQELYATKGLRNFEDYEQDMRNAFKALDSENNGKIMEHELRHILRNLGAGRIPATEVDLLMTEVHPDPSGGVVPTSLTPRTTTNLLTNSSAATRLRLVSNFNN